MIFSPRFLAAGSRLRQNGLNRLVGKVWRIAVFLDDTLHQNAHAGSFPVHLRFEAILAALRFVGNDDVIGSKPHQRVGLQSFS